MFNKSKSIENIKMIWLVMRLKRMVSTKNKIFRKAKTKWVWVFDKISICKKKKSVFVKKNIWNFWRAIWCFCWQFQIWSINYKLKKSMDTLIWDFRFLWNLHEYTNIRIIFFYTFDIIVWFVRISLRLCNKWKLPINFNYK